MQRQRRLSVENRCDELLEVCLRLIGTRDWDGVTMADIAAEAQISKGLIYHYFSTKPDIYRAAIARAAAQLSDATRPERSLSAPQQLRHSLLHHVDWIEEHRLAYRAILRGGLSGEPGVQAIVESSRSEAVDRVVAVLGLTSVSPLMRASLRGWVGYLEAACLEWLANDSVTKEQLVQMIASVLPAAVRSAHAPAS